MVYGITDLTTFMLGTIFIVLLPGPNSVFVLSTASMHGTAAGYRAAAGVFVGDAILMLLASMGAASVLYTNPTLFMVLKYAGAAYLSWIGLGLFREAWLGLAQKHTLLSKAQAVPLNTNKQTSPQTDDPIVEKELKRHAGRQIKTSHSAPFRGALLISLLNPKAIFFFISFFVQFVDPNYDHPVLTFFLLGTIVEICSVAYLAMLIHGGAHLARRMHQYPRLNALAAGAVGSIFIWFGIKLASATL
ncbi:leucine efflux protein LeuE [Orrella daihaiensis]|uniref:Leucine efflux protein LeuE n=1 Tax=Orrella daihaiensis TaxID=2782176 RepID=A0ABY4AMZ3_9BURK|nr:leucine efflux protein LeuE [Orrella daihaiensis]